jgi:hypothetical protein
LLSGDGDGGHYDVLRTDSRSCVPIGHVFQ